MERESGLGFWVVEVSAHIIFFYLIAESLSMHFLYKC